MSNMWHMQASSPDLTEDDDGEEDYECHTVYTARCLLMKVPSQQQGHHGQTRDVMRSPSTDGHIELNRTRSASRRTDAA